MHLTVHSLKKTLFDAHARSLNCKTTSGEITVLDNHRPLVTVLASGTVTIIDESSKEHYFPVTGGFLEVQDGNAARMIVEE